MSNVIQRSEAASNAEAASKRDSKTLILLVLTLMLVGRAMTLAFIGDAGAATPGAPPAAWLMPLIGDALIGLTALPVAALVWRGGGLFGWTAIVTWNALAIWDALSAYLLHLTAPWPAFFMIEIFGASMFFLASAMHAACIFLACSPSVRARYGLA